ncbi:MAG: diguanylate cyclase [bacterium]|nr:diguanylate cyclase [bacterium]
MNAPQPGINQLNADLAESLRDGRFVSLVLFDIDRFHQINADLGEETGDAILALVGEVLANMAPVSYRIGGDSHAVLGLTAESADKLRGAVKEAAQERLQAHVSLSGGGVSVAPDLLVASEEAERLLYAAASKMLALAKQGGRDEIVWLADDGPFDGETGEAALQLFRDLARVNASRARQMEVASKVDPLTGLFNRRGFEDIFGRMVDSAQRTERPLGLLYMDSDSLKVINDRDGHEAGDRFIVDLASILRSVARRSDFNFRWGADEFAVVLESGNAARAATLAERLREAVAERTGGTVSIGIYCGVPESAEEAVRIADAAMYDAKRRGKDRVVVSLQD